MSESVSESPAVEFGDETGRLQLDDLRALLAVARTGSFRSAARQLFISQPTVSRCVARLESDLGVQLFTRGARGVTLTEQGQATVAGARRVLAAVTDMRRGVSPSGRMCLRLGATATTARTILAPFLSRWIPDHPDVEVKAIEDSEHRLHGRLENGDCDVAVVSTPLARTVEALRITTAKITAYFPSAHRLAGPSEPVTVADLAEEPLLLNGDGFPSTRIVKQLFEAAGLVPRIAYECSVGQTLAAMAEAGMGVAVFGSTTDLRGFTLSHRDLVDAAGRPLSFDLYASWLRDAVPEWIREFAIELATFSASGPGRPRFQTPTPTPPAATVAEPLADAGTVGHASRPAAPDRRGTRHGAPRPARSGR